MASKIAVYQFSSRDAAEAAYDKIRNYMSNGVYRDGDRIEIYDDCTDSSKAAQICMANGGSAR